MDDRQKSDLLYLDGPLTADAILKSIHLRFLEQKNVSWLGPVMVFLNTFTPVSGLGAVLRRFCKEIVDEMEETGKNEAIVLGGVCGSGKTHLADCLVSEIGTSLSGSDEMIKNLMMARIVLHSIGTAFTPVNKETSRLGRMVDFGIQNCTIKRIKFNCVYLDQSRLVAPSRFESNYQIFYQLLSGLSPEDRAKLHLGDYSWYNLNYLSQACPPKEDQNKLAQGFELWKTGLAKLGIPFNDIIQVLVSILLLGNITFYESKDKELAMSGEDVLASIATLLGVRPAVLQRGLSKRTYVSGRGETVLTACSAAGANSARDALVKALYVRTMVAIVRRINSLLRPLPSTGQPPVAPHAHLFGGDISSPNRSFGSPSVSEPSQGAELVLSVVDLFGFEKMETNGLEQFCINWTAECLNRHFCVSSFIATNEACHLDGIEAPIECDVYDSAPCLDLLGYHHGGGILQIINQETLSPRVQADDICTRIKQKFEDHSCMKSSKGSIFTIQHFTEEVSYDIISLLNSNADTLADDVVAIFNEKDCKFGFASHLFSHELNKELSGGAQGKMCRITPPSMLTKGSNPDPMRETTTFMQDFQMCMSTQVLAHLGSAHTRFIRCIRGSKDQRPGEFSREYIAQQVKQLSILETLDQYMNGFSLIYTFEEFVRRYWVIVPEVASVARRPQETCKVLLESIDKMAANIEMGEDMWAIGRTKIFLNVELGQLMDKMRFAQRTKSSIRIQKWTRGYLVRKQWPELKISLLQAKKQKEANLSLSQPNAGLNPYESLPTKIPQSRNYTIVGNLKVGFPQWRVMKTAFPEGSSGSPVLPVGLHVFVRGKSQQRGLLLVEHEGQQHHVPHFFTELKIPQSANTPTSNPPVGASKTSDL